MAGFLGRNINTGVNQNAGIYPATYQQQMNGYQPQQGYGWPGMQPGQVPQPVQLLLPALLPSVPLLLRRLRWLRTLLRFRQGSVSCSDLRSVPVLLQVLVQVQAPQLVQLPLPVQVQAPQPALLLPAQVLFQAPVR